MQPFPDQPCFSATKQRSLSPRVYRGKRLVIMSHPGGERVMATRDQDVTHSGGAGPGVLVREGSYGTQVFEVVPGGAEFIPLNERHGRPVQLFWTWTSPNMEFATIFVGVLAVVVFRSEERRVGKECRSRWSP